jgi:hypothetical protein
MNKMDNMFNESEIAGMKAFYQSELQETLKKLEHIKSVLTKIDQSAPKIEIYIGSEVLSKKEAQAEVQNSVQAKKLKRKTRKKTGPKAVWGEFIVNTLKSLNKPLTYEELISEAMSQFKTPKDKALSTRQAVINSAFRLRKHHGEVETVSKKGQKEKYICLIDWFNNDGSLKEQYAGMIGL